MYLSPTKSAHSCLKMFVYRCKKYNGSLYSLQTDVPAAATSPNHLSSQSLLLRAFNLCLQRIFTSWIYFFVFIAFINPSCLIKLVDFDFYWVKAIKTNFHFCFLFVVEKVKFYWPWLLYDSNRNIKHPRRWIHFTGTVIILSHKGSHTEWLPSVASVAKKQSLRISKKPGTHGPQHWCAPS